MKAKLKNPYSININQTIIAGAECEIIDSWCGTDGYYYLCDFGNGDVYPINGINLEITDRHPIINWEQRRYEIAKECVAILVGNGRSLDDAAKLSIKQADTLIKELKKEKEK